MTTNTTTAPNDPDQIVRVRVSVALTGSGHKTVEMSLSDFERLDKAIEGGYREQRGAYDELLDILGSDAFDDIEIDSVDDFMVVPDKE